MRKPGQLLLLPLLSLLLTPATRAYHQFDIRLEDLEVVDCWDPQTCTAVEGRVHLFNVNSPQETHTIPCEISLGGAPLAYRFVADLDSQLQDCEDGAEYEIDERRALFGCPGQEFEVISSTQLVYECGMPFPSRLIPPPTDCADPPQWVDWTWDNFPSGRVELVFDFTVPGDHSLIIDPGMEVLVLPGAALRVEGTLLSRGTAAAPVRFHGGGWEGIEFAPGSSGNELDHTWIVGALSADEGGALTIRSGAQALLRACVVAHNSCQGEGGAAWVEEGGSLVLEHCTFSHNSGGASGGIHLGGAGSLLQATNSILAFSQPTNTDLTGTGQVSGSSTDIFPQASGFPAGMPPPDLQCDPRFQAADSLDFRPAYWASESAGQVSCVVEVGPASGPWTTLGALPCAQEPHPARQTSVVDLPNDQGGQVRLSFLGSTSELDSLSGLTQYGVWRLAPDAPPEDWTLLATLPAAGDPTLPHEVVLPTLANQFGGQPYLHHFRVDGLGAEGGCLVRGNVVAGFSRDNLGPPAVTDVVIGDWEEHGPLFECPVVWSCETPPDFSRYVVLGSEFDDLETAALIHAGPTAGCRVSLELGPPERYHLWIWAEDLHGNAGPVGHYLILEQGLDPLRPGALHLDQNVPNPFNPATRIAFQLPAPTELRLSVYNLAGAEVARLVEGRLSAGRHEALFDGSGLASGVYLYRLETPTRQALGKMLLIK